MPDRFEHESRERLWLTYRVAGVPAVLLLVFVASEARFGVPWAPGVILGLTVLGVLLVLVRRRVGVFPRAGEVAVVLCVAAAIAVLGFTVVPVVSRGGSVTRGSRLGHGRELTSDLEDEAG
jgi:undecaprenyl pyrophosphate phosphatase UppP